MSVPPEGACFRVLSSLLGAQESNGQHRHPQLVIKTLKVESGATLPMVILLVLLGSLLPQLLLITVRVAPEAEDQTKPTEPTPRSSSFTEAGRGSS